MPAELVAIVLVILVVTAWWRTPGPRKHTPFGRQEPERDVCTWLRQREDRRYREASAALQRLIRDPADAGTRVVAQARPRPAANTIPAARWHGAAFGAKKPPPVKFSTTHQRPAKAARLSSNLELLCRILDGDAAQAELDRRRSIAEATSETFQGINREPPLQALRLTGEILS